MSVYNRGNKWYCRFQINGERHNIACQGARNKSEAKAIEDAEKYKLRQQLAGIRNKEKPLSLSQLLSNYHTYNLRYNRQRDPVEKYKAVMGYFGAVKDVTAIAHEDIQSFLESLKITKNLSNSTLNRYRSYLSTAFELMVKQGRLKYNPCKSVKLFEEPKETIKFYTKAEEQKLLEAAEKYNPDFKPIIVWAIYTGLRISNITHMLWEWVNIKERIIEIPPSHNKGKKIIRHYITDEMMSELTRIGVKQSGYVFVYKHTNKPYCNPARVLKSICKKANIKYIGFHGIRHTVGTILAKEKVPINEIQAFLSHSDIRTTMKYIHLTDNIMKNNTCYLKVDT